MANRFWINPPIPGLVEEEVKGVGDFVGECNSFRRVGQRLLQNLLHHLLGVIPLRMAIVNIMKIFMVLLELLDNGSFQISCTNSSLLFPKNGIIET